MLATSPQQHRRAILMLVVANLLWGVSFPLIKSLAFLQQELEPGSSTWFIAACVLFPRFAIAAVVLGIFCWGQLRRLSPGEWRQGVGLGVFAVLGLIFQNDGLQYTAASTSAFLTQFYAIMIPLYLAVRARRRPPWLVWVSGTLVLAGVACLARLDWHALTLGRGEIETLVGSVFFMGQILWLERREFSGNRPLPVTVVMFAGQAVVAGLMLLALAPPATRVPELLGSGLWLGLTALLTVLCTLGAFTFMNVWQPRITATEAGLLYCSEPIFTSVFALFLPGWFAAWGGFAYTNETMTMNLLIGGGLITAANGLVQLKPSRTAPGARR